MRPFIGPVHDLFVGPFEIECIDEGLPQTLILQFFPSRIEEPTLRARGGIVWNNIALDVPLADRREVVACRPSPRCEFFPEQIASGSESLEGNFAIAVIFVAHDVKIVQPAPDRQVGPPPVFHSLVLNMTARLETSDLVRAAAERYLERGFVEPTGSIIAAREDRERSEAVQRVGLVLGARHQAREGELHALCTIALKDEAVERIEGEKVLIEGPSCPDVGEYAGLRGVWIDVIEMFEVGRIFEIAEGRNPMALGVLTCFDILYEGRYKGSRTEEERFAARLLESISH